MDDRKTLAINAGAMQLVDGQRLVDLRRGDEGLLGLPADIIEAAHAGLPPDDVRCRPYPLEIFEEEMDALANRRRWTIHGVDVLALRLQYGRGMSTADVGALFGFAQKTVQQRVREGKWSHAMSEANRIDLARRVWLAGLAGLGRQCTESADFKLTAAMLQALREASAWQTLPPEKAVWEPLDDSAHAAASHAPVSQHVLERQALLDNPANPDRTYRERVAANLQRLIERLERQQREEAEAAAAEGGEETGGEPENSQE
jgi:hypothetical protein